MERLADPATLGGLDENDPQSMAQWMKTMAGEMGEDLDSDMIEEMESANGAPTEAQDESSA
jgi:hypothetical protein